MKVQVERCVEQVQDGSHYKGYVKIAGTRLDYELVFTVPIPQLDDMEPVKGKDETRSIFQLTVRRDEAAKIELTDDEYDFFLSLLAIFAVEFYNNPRTRDVQKSILGVMFRGAYFGIDGASVSLSMTTQGSCDFSPEVCKMLSVPKFGCVFA